MLRTAIQLHTLRGIDEPLPDLLSRVGETTFDGVELYDGQFDALTDETVLARTKQALADADLEVVGAHVSVERLESEPETLVDVCRTLDCSRVVVPTYDAEAFADRDGVRAAADRLADLATSVDGFTLLYHNHAFEFGDLNGEIAFEAFADAAGDRFGFEPDTGLATYAGYSPSELLDVTAGRAPLVHLTNTDPTRPEAHHVDPTEGIVDLEAAASAAIESGAEWLVCENGSTSDPHTTLERGSEVFASLRDDVDGR